MKHEIRYGKADVRVYRTHAEPLTGITSIPESPFAGRDNTLAAAEIEVVVRGEVFLDAYTKGDNRLVVATDTMKNFIHAVSLRARARTLEEWLFEVGTAFLDTYPQMELLTMIGRDLSFPAALVPSEDGFEASARLFARDRSDYGSARLDLARDEDGSVRITDHESGRRELQLIKITGSAFADFARDEHTTLPERPDRPLYIWCDIGWHYADASHAVLADPARYVAAEQVADLANAVFHEFVSLPSSTSSTRSVCACSTDGHSSTRSASTPRTASGTSSRNPRRIPGYGPTATHVRRSGTSVSCSDATDGRSSDDSAGKRPNYRRGGRSRRIRGRVRPGTSIDGTSPMTTAPIRS